MARPLMFVVVTILLLGVTSILADADFYEAEAANLLDGHGTMNRMTLNRLRQHDFDASGEAPQPADAFGLVSNHFGFKLLNQFSADNERHENIFFSPYSIAVALAMVHQGAGGNTAKQLESALGFDLVKWDTGDKTLVARSIHQSIQKIITSKSKVNSYKLQSANAMVVHQHFPLAETFKETLATNFGADHFLVDFANSPTDAMDLINKWAAQQTNGKIEKLLAQPLSHDTKLALLNAIYFKGIWKKKFPKEGTVNGTFTGHNGVTYQGVQFMNIEGSFKVAQLAEVDAAMIELPYQGDELSMFAILPNNKRDGLAKVKATLSPEYLETAIHRAYSKKIYLKFPKLDFKTDYDLNKPLQSLGITDMFEAGKADLSGVSATGQKLVVGQAIHKATIEVNEEGSEAAAATITFVHTIAAFIPPSYEFTHPFVFLIRHNANGQILFLGEVNKF